MCRIWNDEDWQQKSQPADPGSRYILKETRFNQDGKVARTYREINGDYWGVLPGKEMYKLFQPKQANYEEEYNDPHGAALYYLADRGFTLTEPPVTSSSVLSEPVKDIS